MEDRPHTFIDDDTTLGTHRFCGKLDSRRSFGIDVNCKTIYSSSLYGAIEEISGLELNYFLDDRDGILIMGKWIRMSRVIHW